MKPICKKKEEKKGCVKKDYFWIKNIVRVLSPVFNFHSTQMCVLYSGHRNSTLLFLPGQCICISPHVRIDDVV